MRVRPLVAGCFVVAFVSTGTLDVTLLAQQRLVGIGSNPSDPLPTKPPSGKPRLSKDLQIDGADVWTATGIQLAAGERLTVTADGAVRCPGQEADIGPNGLPRGFRDLLRNLPVNTAGRGALIGRVGEDDVVQPFSVGSNRDIEIPAGGALSLGVNQTEGPACTGTYSVHVDVYAASDAASSSITKEVTDIAGIDLALFTRIPRRIGDNQGNAGDMVNFLIVGSEEAMKRAFTAAGWVKVDADVRSALVAGVLGSLSKESYLTMPMSQLYLFGRPQDYGWAHAEPIKVVESRHHLRVWKAPFDVGGATCWVGAATHDIGFERDRRNNGITHKIDPDIDLERDYLRKTFIGTGLVAEFTHVLPENALREAKTATGGSFHSNGEVLVLRLK